MYKNDIDLKGEHLSINDTYMEQSSHRKPPEKFIAEA